MERDKRDRVLYAHVSDKDVIDQAVGVNVTIARKNKNRDHAHKVSAAPLVAKNPAIYHRLKKVIKSRLVGYPGYIEDLRKKKDDAEYQRMILEPSAEDEERQANKANEPKSVATTFRDKFARAVSDFNKFDAELKSAEDQYLALQNLKLMEQRAGVQHVEREKARGKKFKLDIMGHGTPGGTGIDIPKDLKGEENSFEDVANAIKEGGIGTAVADDDGFIDIRLTSCNSALDKVVENSPGTKTTRSSAQQLATHLSNAFGHKNIKVKGYRGKTATVSVGEHFDIFLTDRDGEVLKDDLGQPVKRKRGDYKVSFDPISKEALNVSEIRHQKS